METFELKEAHIQLLQALSWNWANWEYGGIEVDAKRPFGFSGGIANDIAHIIGLEVKDELTYEQRDDMMILYQETYTALIVILDTKSFSPGKYVKEDRKWIKN